MTSVVPTPAAPTVPIYPALGSASFNTEAYAYGSAMPAVTLAIFNIGKSAETNATIAEDAAQAAVPAAAQSTQARDQVLPARDQTLAARDQAVPAAAAALDAAQRAEAAAESIEDGPVTSVNNQTGVVDLTADLHSIALLF